MIDVLLTTLTTYAALSVFGFGAIAATALTGPARLVVFAMMLLMAAAPHSDQMGGPRL